MSDRVLTAEEAAEVLRLPLSTVHQLCRSGKLPMRGDGIHEEAMMDMFEPTKCVASRPERRIDGPDVSGVYFLRAKRANRIKIGSAGSIRSRVVDLHRASPEPLELIAYVSANDPLSCERAWHRLFGSSRVHHEWFRPTRLLHHMIRIHARKWP